MAAINVPLKARIARRFGLSRNSRHQPGCFQTISSKAPNSADHSTRWMMISTAGTLAMALK
ncbi:hypothetical protein D3C86_2163490 [compost metagenome]